MQPLTSPTERTPGRDEIRTIVLAVLSEISESLPQPLDLSQGDDLPLYGKGGSLDSLELVNTVLLLEEQMDEVHGVSISLTSDRALSQFRSPFRTVGTLVDAIETLSKAA